MKRTDFVGLNLLEEPRPMGWATALATITGAVSAMAAAVGLVFAGWRLRITHKDREEDHQVAREGVAVSWRPVLAPVSADPERHRLVEV